MPSGLMSLNQPAESTMLGATHVDKHNTNTHKIANRNNSQIGNNGMSVNKNPVA